jgi:hypothetical protein
LLLFDLCLKRLSWVIMYLSGLQANCFMLSFTRPRKLDTLRLYFFSTGVVDWTQTALYMLGKSPTTKPHASPWLSYLDAWSFKFFVVCCVYMMSWARVKRFQ